MHDAQHHVCLELTSVSCRRCAWITVAAQSLAQSGCPEPVHADIRALRVTRWWLRGEVIVGFGGQGGS